MKKQEGDQQEKEKPKKKPFTGVESGGKPRLQAAAVPTATAAAVPAAAAAAAAVPAAAAAAALAAAAAPASTDAPGGEGTQPEEEKQSTLGARATAPSAHR